jgi:hypothetical protein
MKKSEIKARANEYQGFLNSMIDVLTKENQRLRETKAEEYIANVTARTDADKYVVHLVKDYLAGNVVIKQIDQEASYTELHNLCKSESEHLFVGNEITIKFYDTRRNKNGI